MGHEVFYICHGILNVEKRNVGASVNERDSALVKELAPMLEGRSEPTIYLMASKYTSLVRVNLVLLKAFLDEKKSSGVMITIDRPHQYASHLLQLHGIDQSGLTFLDAISSHASDTKAEVKGGQYSEGPFYIERLPAFMAGSDGVSPPGIDLVNVRFVIIDNVSTLLTYNSMESLKAFFSNYIDVMRKKASGNPITVFVMDKDLHGALFEFISGLAAKVIDLTPDMRIGDVEVRPRAESADRANDGSGSGDA
jgi:hypothetical protein